MEFNFDILKLVNENDYVSSTYASEILKQPHQKIVGTIKSLESLGNVIEVNQIINKTWMCTDEGKKLATDGSHEAQLFNFISADGETIENIKSNFSASAIALGAALKNKWLKKEGNKVYRCVESITDIVKINLNFIEQGSSSDVDNKIKLDYKKRKLIKEIETTTFEVRKGVNFSVTATKQEAELTKEMIETGQWKTKSFKPFNFKAKGKQEQRPGYLHPLMQLRGEFRHIFLEMGFAEMPTNNYIESAFWNFDALFQPQQHPARDAQDTFYISNPEKTLSVPMDYLEKVKTVHTVGAYNSVGYRSPWSYEESQKNLLRTHTTAVSARLLYKLAQDGFKPAKYFSIDKVYRNETLDATHLAEFHQVEGVIADYDLSMKHLMGIFTAFFKKIGIKTLRFKPTYNPYTEPSMEMFTFHEGLNKWVEVGNSGYFRPEMLLPMGLPENVTVAGWGLSLERPAMIMFGINNIRELIGSKVKMDLIYDNPICTIDKFGRRDREAKRDPIDHLIARQENCVGRLSHVQSTVDELTKQRRISVNEDCRNQHVGVMPLSIVITADPKSPPHSLIPLVSLLSHQVLLDVIVHSHSSVEISEVNENCSKLWSNLTSKCDQGETRHRLTLIWKSCGSSSSDPAMIIDPLNAVKIEGETNIARYLCRLLDSLGDKSRLYERFTDRVNHIDFILDRCQEALSPNGSKKKSMAFVKEVLNTEKKSAYLCGESVSVADLLWVSTLRHLNLLSLSSRTRAWHLDPMLSLVLRGDRDESA